MTLRSFGILLSLTAAMPLASSPAHAATRAAPQAFPQFFAKFRAAVLANDRAKVAGMVALPFKDFSGGEIDRSARTQAEFLARYDAIFTPAVVSAIRSGKVRAFAPGTDDGEAPGPITKGEYLLDAPEFTDQLVFSLKDGRYLLTRTPFYS